MKTIGRTENGGFIVEMSDIETHSFYRLYTTVKGEPVNFYTPHMNMDGTDLSPVLDALNDLFHARENVLFLKQSIDSLDKLLGTIIKEES